VKIPNKILHKLCAVTWYDASGGPNAQITTLKPPRVINVGQVYEIHRKSDPIPYIILQTSFSPDNPDVDTFDCTVIPSALITDIDVKIQDEA